MNSTPINPAAMSSASNPPIPVSGVTCSETGVATAAGVSVGVTGPDCSAWPPTSPSSASVACTTGVLVTVGNDVLVGMGVGEGTRVSVGVGALATAGKVEVAVGWAASWARLMEPNATMPPMASKPSTSNPTRNIPINTNILFLPAIILLLSLLLRCVGAQRSATGLKPWDERHDHIILPVGTSPRHWV